MKQLEILKQKGYKLTSQRKEILNVLNGAVPLSAQEIHNFLQKKNIDADLATIYRSLEMLVETGIICQLEFGEGKKRYELIDVENHHHHLICNNCGDIKDISLNKEEQLFKQVALLSSFKIQSHNLEIFGLCSKCQK